MATPCPTATAFLRHSSYDPPPQHARLLINTLVSPSTSRWSSTRMASRPCPTATVFLPHSSFDPPPQPACLRLDTLVPPPRINRRSTPRPPSNSPRYGRTAHWSTTSSRRTDPESSKSTTESHRRPQRSSSPRRRSHPHRPNRPHHRIHQPRHLCR